MFLESNALASYARATIAHPPKLYSLHAPEVECVAKGKAHKQYEFDVKVGVASTSKESFVLAAKSLPGNPYDGHTLQACIEQARRVTGVAPNEAYADRGYKRHGCHTDFFKVWISGSKPGVTQAIERKLKRRNAVAASHMFEPIAAPEIQ